MSAPIRSRRAALGGAFSLLLVGLSGQACDKGASPPAPSGGAPAPGTTGGPATRPAQLDASAEADRIYTMRCVPCHGPQGAGDGPASAGLTPRPRNFREPAWQQAVKDDHIERIIAGGGAAAGRSASMPPNPDLAGKPAVLAALRQKIRGFAAPR